MKAIKAGQEIRQRKVVAIRPLGDEDPIWDLVGAGESRRTDVSGAHDTHLAAGELERWRESSSIRARCTR